MLHRFSRQAIAVLGVAVSMGAPFAIQSSASARKTNFWFHNNSSIDIVRMYISSSSNPNWLDAGGGIASERARQVVFPNPYGRPCLYDFKLFFRDGSSYEIYRVNACTDDGHQIFDR